MVPVVAVGPVGPVVVEVVVDAGRTVVVVLDVVVLDVVVLDVVVLDVVVLDVVVLVVDDVVVGVVLDVVVVATGGSGGGVLHGKANTVGR